MRDRRECVGDRRRRAREISNHPRQLQHRRRIANQVRRCGERPHVALGVGHLCSHYFVVDFVEHCADREEWQSARGGFCRDRGGFHVDRDRAGGFLGASLFGAGCEYAMRRQNRAGRIRDASARERSANRAQMRVADNYRGFAPSRRYQSSVCGRRGRGRPASVRSIALRRRRSQLPIRRRVSNPTHGARFQLRGDARFRGRRPRTLCRRSPHGSHGGRRSRAEHVGSGAA